ncbi:MAG: hypothetical protein HY735_02705 [Verrucomicrobia bacterium]|nr:hypothetical protein [Verrucomicrobiota bacterium]
MKSETLKHFVLACAILASTTGLFAGAALSPESSGAADEFAGPFASWRDLRRDYGAAGDGQTDDTGAWQRALDALTKHTNHCVLYVPAGTYRLTRTIGAVRRAHTDMQSVAVLGEDPVRTLLRYDGTNAGTVLRWDAWYAKISRLTIDGASRATVALYVGDSFSTYNETSDMVFRDAAVGIQFGDAQQAGQAENAVLRCQFLRCAKAGIQTVNFNSMDIWVWHSRFEDCGHALFNVMGNFHAWQNLFLRSRVADIGTQNLMVFSFVGNTSIGSRRFLDFDSAHTWGSPTTIAANRILAPTGDLPLKLGNAGPYLVMDNLFQLPAGSTNRAVQMTWGDQTFVGNAYTTTNAVVERGRFRRVSERVVPPGEIDAALSVLPATPPRRQRRVIEVAAGADADTIQRALDEAAQHAGQRPVVHLPMGVYRSAKTLRIRRGSDVQLIGDSGAEDGSRLNWIGPAGGILLQVEGPSRATLRDLHLHAPNARALLIDNADQPGGRVFADQLNVNGPGQRGEDSPAAALIVDGLDRTRVQLRCLQGSGNGVGWVEVSGGPAAASAPPVEIFCGATGSARGQYHVRNGGRLVVRGVYHEKSADALRGVALDDSGELAIDTTRFSYKTSPTAPLVAVGNFRGRFTIASGLLLPVDSTNSCRIEITGDGRDSEVLALNNSFWIEEPGVTAARVWQNRATPPARGGLVGCNVNSGKKGITPNGFAFLENIGDHPDPARSKFGSAPPDHLGSVSDESLLRHLAALRAASGGLDSIPAPTRATDLALHRVMATGGVLILKREDAR